MITQEDLDSSVTVYGKMEEIPQECQSVTLIVKCDMTIHFGG